MEKRGSHLLLADKRLSWVNKISALLEALIGINFLLPGQCMRTNWPNWARLLGDGS